MTDNINDNNLSQVDNNKVQTLLKVLEGSILFTQNAREAMNNNDDRTKSENISKVISILTQLDCALDINVGGELAQNLSGLYKYMMNRLTYANIQDDPEILNEVISLLTNIKEGFDGAALKTTDNTTINKNISTNQKSNERGLRIDI